MAIALGFVAIGLICFYLGYLHGQGRLRRPQLGLTRRATKQQSGYNDHPPACNCVDCVQARLRRMKSTETKR